LLLPLLLLLDLDFERDFEEFLFLSFLEFFLDFFFGVLLLDLLFVFFLGISAAVLKIDFILLN